MKLKFSAGFGKTVFFDEIFHARYKLSATNRQFIIMLKRNFFGPAAQHPIF